MRAWDALDVSWPDPPDDDTVDRLLAELDEAAPTAVEPRGPAVRVFFGSPAARDHAAILAARFRPLPTITAIQVSDEDWAERSQASLPPVRVGRIVVVPVPSAEAPPPAGDADVSGRTDSQAPDLRVLIVPSMGFGTGHHASTRLCLGLIQDTACGGASILDVGTGSGVLAIAAARLGAAEVLGMDVDADALESARVNLAINHMDRVTLAEIDLEADAAGLRNRFDVVTANLTGAMLLRASATLAACLAPAGALIVSGFEEDEAESIRDAFTASGLALEGERTEDRWMASLWRARAT